MEVIVVDESPKWKVGDRVTTTFEPEAKHVIRRIMKVETGADCESGIRINADAGPPCPCCEQPLACNLVGIDSGWFKHVD